MKKVKLTWDPQASVAENARRQLPALVSHFFAAGRKTISRHTPLAELHAFRLEAKRFRYTLELFRPVFGPGLGRRIAELRRMQTLLGDINDCVITRQLVLNAAGRRIAEARQVLDMLESRIDRKLGELDSFWRSSFDAPGEEQRWARYLAVYAGRCRAPRKAAAVAEAPAPAAAEPVGAAG